MVDRRCEALRPRRSSIPGRTTRCAASSTAAPAAGPGIGCVLRGELSVDGQLVQPFGAFVEPAEVSGRGSFVRVVLVRAEDSNGDAVAQGTIHL